MPVLRGHGAASPAALRGVTWRDWVSDAESAMNDLLTEVEKVIVIGLSMGSLITITLAAEREKQIDSIILIAPIVRLTNPMAPGRPFYFVTKAFGPLLRYMKRDWPPVYADPALAQYNTNYLWVPLDAGASALVFSEVARKRLGDVEVPALIIQSHADSTVAPESATIIYNEISTPLEQKRIVWFEKSEHEMLRDCESEAVVDEVVKYVRERIGVKDLRPIPTPH
jgi:carboxylesterase